MEEPIDAQVFAAQSVIPLFIGQSDGSLDECVSAVLLRIDNLYFALTAGHVVRDLGRGESMTLGEPLRRSQTFSPHAVRSASPLAVETPENALIAHAPRIDAGVIQIASRDERSAARLRDCSLTLEDIELFESTACADWRGRDLVIAGYPQVLRVPAFGTAPGYTLLVNWASVAGDLFPEPLTEFGDEAMLCIVANETEYITDEGETVPAVARLGGVSGGGYFVEWRNDAGASATKLVATHARSSEPLRRESDGRLYRYAWGSPLRFHLALISARFPAVRELVERRWPFFNGLSATLRPDPTHR